MAEDTTRRKRAIITIAKSILGTREDRIKAAQELAQIEGIELTDEELRQL